MSEWRTDRPEKPGYYLAAWKRPDRYVVSELWFNPSGIGTGWFSTRGYLDPVAVYGRAMTLPVVAWQPMPSYTPEAGQDE